MQPRRLDQILSNYGYCSRSEAKLWIKRGRVAVKGATAETSNQKADPSLVEVDGQPIEAPEGLLALFYKPAGYVCSHDAKEGPNIYGLLPPQWSRRNPPVTSVGRLDKDTTGVLLVTDDGALVQRWTSPRHKVPKIYELTVNQDLNPSLVHLFGTGSLQLEGEAKPCAPAKLEILSRREARLELTEGKYHQVKRMFASQGYEVLRLHRSRFGDFDLEGLNPGEWRVVPIERWRKSG
jgi:16S rRNA pseudouridine516 synthase